MANPLYLVGGKPTAQPIASSDVGTALATPPAIGGTTPSTGKFTTLTTTGAINGPKNTLDDGSGNLTTQGATNILGGTAQGNFKHVANGLNSYLAVADTAGGRYYGVTNGVSGRITNFVGFAGFYNGFALETAGNLYDNAYSAFTILAQNQTTWGVGNALFTVTLNGQVNTYKNVLDDGAGNMVLAGSLDNTAIGFNTVAPSGRFSALTSTTGVAATSSTNQSSGTHTFVGAYYNASSASATDTWTIQSVLGTGTTPTTTLVFSQTGSTGVASVTLPALNNTPIGAVTASTGKFTTLAATSLDTTPIGANTPSTGAFTTFSASGTTTLVAGMKAVAFAGGAWLDMPTSGASGIGSGGAGTNPWVGYASGAGNYINNSVAGDICYRATGTSALLFGNSSSTNGALRIANNIIQIGLAQQLTFDSSGNLTTGATFSVSTAATSSTNYSSSILTFAGTYYNASSASAADTWTAQSVVGTGTTPTSILTFAHTGTSGSATVVFPSINSTPIGTTTAAAGKFTTLAATSLDSTPIGANTASTAKFTTLAATSMDSTPVGANTPSTGKFTTLAATGATTLAAVTATSLNSTPIGATTASTGTFTTLVATSINTTPIGATTPSTGAFTTLSATGATTVAGITASAAITANGGLNEPGKAVVTATYQALITDTIIQANTTSAAFTITLPTTPGNGQLITVIKIDSTTGNALTISAAAKINGATTTTITAQYGVLRLWYSPAGSTWYLL